MVDLVITAANVMSGADARIENGFAGVVVTAGQVVYLDPADNRYKLADTDSAVVAARNPRGIALNGAAAGQPLAVQRSGDIAIGGTLVSATAYYLSGNPGGICPAADLAPGDFTAVLGVSKSTSVLALWINAPGVSL